MFFEEMLTMYRGANGACVRFKMTTECLRIFGFISLKTCLSRTQFLKK
ncbi:hypothetical protein C7379_1187 [Hallella colorans]|uniref:Uncharacterized protein n=1 Tax=Hallella colorans TaxID=1703337 RepID=A0A2U0U1G8_9BACT|nr:hypothetical protein C7379_1187 [Hallella colorans]